MGQDVIQDLDTRAPLDTSNQISDRAPGTLVVALDVGHRWWGPREGGKSITQPHDMPTVDKPRSQTHSSFDGASTYVHGPFVSSDQRDLGVRWTLDIVFSADSVDHGAFDEAIIFKWVVKTSATAVDAITVGLRGTSAGSAERKIRATITPTTAADTPGTTKTLDATTQLTVGTDEEDRHHIRLVRDGKTATLYVNGTSEATASGMSKRNGHVGSADVGRWEMGNAAAPNFKGIIFYAALRDGVYENADRGYPMAVFPRSGTFRLLADPINLAASTMTDHSLYRAHGPVFGDASGGPQDSHPHPTPVQGMATFTDIKGIVWNVVICGGMMYTKRVGA